MKHLKDTHRTVLAVLVLCMLLLSPSSPLFTARAQTSDPDIAAFSSPASVSDTSVSNTPVSDISASSTSVTTDASSTLISADNNPFAPADAMPPLSRDVSTAGLSGIALDIANARNHLIKHNLSPVIEDRLKEFEQAHGNDSAQGLAPQVNPVSDAPLPQNDPHPFRSLSPDVSVITKPESAFAAMQAASSLRVPIHLESRGALRLLVPDEKTLAASSDDKTSGITSSATAITSSAPLSAPASATAAGGEIIITQNIKDRAALLNYDPLAILNFVRNNIVYEPYYGSKKGADATLIERSGNDADQAALLIALLRAGDPDGNHKTPAHYRASTIKIDLGAIMDLVGVEDPIVAAKVLGQARIPYTLFVDGAGQPLFFLMEHVYVEAYIEYNEYRGAVQTGQTGIASKQWIPMDSTIMATNYFRTVNVLSDMEKSNSFYKIDAFYDRYLSGFYGTKKPIDALKDDIGNYLASSTSTPALTYDDILIQEYRQNNNLEFIPRTLPYTVITDLGTYDQMPDNFRHKLNIKITTATSTLLNYTAFASDLADKEKVIAYAPATQEDQDLLDSYPSIYDVVPLSMLHLKPVFKVRGIIIAGGQSADPDVVAGKTLTLEMAFLSPRRDLSGTLADNTDDTIAKPTLAGNAEAIAVNTGKIVAPEAFPANDTSSSEFLPTQKLYRTALNFLDRLEQSHDELSSITGIRFTNVATRAIVFNGINVEYAGPDPYRFTWKGLRIDASSVVAPYNHFGVDINKDITKFTYVFGLSASLDESAVFEEDFPGVEAISTVKGLRMINQGLIPGVSMVKITQTNVGIIDTLSVSQETKNRYYDAIAKGNTVYTPTAPFTYANWTGLVSITIDPQGFGSYLIGEGLNGGYTVEEFPDGWRNLLIKFTPGLTATIVSPKNGDVFMVGQPFKWTADYNSSSIPFVSWREEANLEGILPEGTPSGPVTIWSGYGTGASVEIMITAKKLGKLYPGFDDLFFKYGAANEIPPDLLKSMAYQESCCIYSDQLKQQIFDPRAYRYEAHKDYDWYSGPSVDAADRIKRHPERHFAIGGTAIHGPVESGDQVPEKSVYLGWSRHMGGYPNGLDTSADTDGNLTAQELLDKNPDRFWLQYKDSGENWNFTAQLLLASSYGILQAMYDTALTRMVAAGIETKRPADDPKEKPHDATEITDLFDPEMSVKIGAKYLKLKYDENGHNWFEALRLYNGADSYATAVIKNWNNGNGIFKEVTE